MLWLIGIYWFANAQMDTCRLAQKATMVPAKRSQPTVSFEVQACGPKEAHRLQVSFKMGDKEVVQETAVFNQGDLQLVDAQQLQSHRQVTLTKEGTGYKGELKHEQKTKSTTVSSSQPMMVGLGLPEFIYRRWEELLKKKQRIGLFVPSRFASYEFEIEHLDHCRFKMTAVSFAVRLMASPAFFNFDCDSKKLKQIEGRFPVLVSNGSSLHESEWVATYEPQPGEGP